MFYSITERYFTGFGTRLSQSFCRYVDAAVSACSCSTHEIARHLSKQTGRSFNTSDKSLSYLLSNDIFQVDDKFWRMHMRMVFDLMEEQSLISKGDKIHIQVDFTSHEDYFLILCASVVVNNRAVPIYFSMRNYPKRKKQFDQKKMEKAFLKGLRHVLSKKYKYVILADRGFGNQRFIEICEGCGFEYIIRIEPNIMIDNALEHGICSQLLKNDGVYNVHVKKWQKNISITKHSKNGSTWY